MESLVVVAVTPILGHAAYLTRNSEYAAVQNFGTEAAIESLHIGVSSRLIEDASRTRA